MGRNLYNLLIGSSLQRNQPNQPLIDANMPSPTRGGSAEKDNLPQAAPKMGLWSHGTTHTSLNSTGGSELTRSFRLPNPIKLADKLKARLAQETPVPEWELIEDDDFGPNDLDDGVLIGGTPQSKARTSRFGLESYMSVNTVRSNGYNEAKIPGINDGMIMTPQKERASNGWTKIKPR